MVACPVCHTSNKHLETVCTSCGSFIQPKVDNLDLFATVWRLFESPLSTFHRIAIASHKNYTFVIAVLMGFGVSFGILWFVKIGNENLDLARILALGVLSGPLVGILTLYFFAFLQKIVGQFFRYETNIRRTTALIAYASVPVAFSAIFLLPVEILTFGQFFFSSNPSPMLIKPVSYLILLALDGICVAWTLALYVMSIQVLYDINTRRALTVSVATLALAVSLGFGLTKALPPLMLNESTPKLPVAVAELNIYGV